MNKQDKNRQALNKGVLGASFLVVGIFVIAYIAAYFFIQYQPWFRLSTSFQPTIIAFAGLVVIPLILAFLWDRIVRANIFGVEFELDKIKLNDTRYEAKYETYLNFITDYSSINKDILRYIVSFIQKIRQTGAIKIVEIELIDGGVPWTMAHLYLLAALLEDFTEIEQIVFVTKDQDQKRSVIGFAKPSSIRHAIARKFPALEIIYRRAHLESMDPDYQRQNFRDITVRGLIHIIENYTASSNSNSRNYSDESRAAWDTKVTVNSFSSISLGLDLANNSLEDQPDQMVNDPLNRPDLQEIMNSTKKNIQSNPGNSTRFLAITHGEDLLIVDLLKLTVDVVDGVLKADKKSSKVSK